MRSIYVVIVLYKIRLEDAISYQTLIKPNHINEFFVYDNSPEDFNQSTKSFHSGVTYVRDYNNNGLSRAYNIGAHKAQELGYQKVLLLDQDTSFDASTWKVYLDNLHYPGIVAPILTTNQGEAFSPVNIKGWKLQAVQTPVSGDYSLFDFAVVNSGCCIPLSLFNATGGYLENVKLDFADFQFQLLARQFCPVFRLINSVAVQDFSNDVTDVNSLLNRQRLYLQSAAAFRSDTYLQKAKHHYLVLRHCLALMIRTRNIQFLTNYLKIFLLER